MCDVLLGCCARCIGGCDVYVCVEGICGAGRDTEMVLISYLLHTRYGSDGVDDARVAQRLRVP